VWVAPGPVGAAGWKAPGPAATLSGGEVRAVEPGATATLSQDDLLALVAPIRYELRNDGAEPATALVAAGFPPGGPRRSTARPQLTSNPWPPGIARQELTDVAAARVPFGAVVAGIGRATLAPGARLVNLAAPGPVLLAVEDGSLDFAATVGEGWVRRGTDG